MILEVLYNYIFGGLVGRPVPVCVFYNLQIAKAIRLKRIIEY